MFSFLLFFLAVPWLTTPVPYCAAPHIPYTDTSCLAPGGIDDFYSANLRCLNMNGYLVTIYDDFTNEMVLNMTRERLTGPGTWLGIDQRDEWASGDFFNFTNWLNNTDQIDPDNEVSQCGYMDVDTGEWMSTNCTNRVAFLCMVDPDPDPEHVCLQIVSNDTGKIPNNKCSVNGQHCEKHWRVLAMMVLTYDENYELVLNMLDRQTKSCNKHDQAYYISPSKMNSDPSEVQLEPFSKNYFTSQYKKFPLDDSLDNDFAGNVMADMMVFTQDYLVDHPLADDEQGLLYIFLDVNCSFLCTLSQSYNQSSFLVNLIGAGYIVQIHPIGDSNQTDCANLAFPQCAQLHTDQCEVMQYFDETDFKLPTVCIPYKLPLLMIIGMSVGIGIILVMLIALIYLRVQFIRNGKYSRFWIAMAGVKLADIYGIEPDEWELDKDQLEINLEKELGSGAFAIVFEGHLSGRRPVDELIPSAQFIADRKELVAVKRVPPHANKVAKQEFISEVQFMKKLGYHSHILGMIGCIVCADLPLMVLEYCENGDLLGYVRKNKDGFDVEGNGTLRPKDLLSISWQISDGLCYLKTLDLIHRDLAARNILLTKDLIAKISDFGLCRQPELSDSSSIYVSKGGRLPVKWMAIESLRDFHFSFQTDIWSFGVLLWEMYTFGEAPWQTINPTAMLEILESGERLPQENIPDSIYKMLMRCWQAEPEDRVEIERLKDDLNDILSSSSQYYGYVVVSNASVVGLEEGVIVFESSEDENERI